MRIALRPPCATLAPFGFDELDYLIGVGLLFRKIVDCDVGAFPRKRNGSRSADARVAASDQRLSAIERPDPL